jgi:hypothetical protein
MALRTRLPLLRQTNSSGGFCETLHAALQVSPTGRSRSSSVATTVTPDGKAPMMLRNVV